jgi:PhnB protein
MTTSTKTAPKTNVKSIPTGFHTITTTLVVKDAAKVIELYKKALGATETMKMCCSESGKIMHAELKIGDSILFISDEAPQMGCMATTSNLWLYVNDCDASYNQAIAGGFTAKMPIADMFWGDRLGSAVDTVGNTWTFATHKLDLTQEQMMAGQKAFMEQMKAKMSSGACSSSKKS